MTQMKLNKTYSILLPNDPRLPIKVFDYTGLKISTHNATLAQVKDTIFKAILQGHTVTLDEYESSVIGAVITIVTKEEIARLNKGYKVVAVEDRQS
jgi:hypothetical protein